MINLIIRTVGKLSPSLGGLDRRILGRLGPWFKLGNARSEPWVAGNGFLLSGETSNLSYIAGTSERHMLNKLVELIPNAGLVVDVGANVGYVALYCAHAALRKNLGCKLYALEPEPGTYQRLVRNLELNKYPVTPVNSAAGCEVGEAKIYSKGTGDGAASLDVREGEGVEEISINVTTLDKIFLSQDKPAKLVIIDVEGFGGEVVEGARGLIERDRPHFCIEIHDNEEFSKINAVLKAEGYRGELFIDDVWGKHYLWSP